MQDSNTYFSICVPTRNRSETLFYCLRSLLHQNFKSYEIIVSDNCDKEESQTTFSLIKDLKSEKIKYFKPDRVLSMTENYEFALSKAKGKYILCMGDDDGLVINSLQYVYDFIQKYDAKVVKCPRIGYGWIGSLWDPNSIMAYPFERPVTQVDSKSILQKVANFELRYSDLPMLYYSFIDRAIIDEVIQEKGNFWQNSASIDMYSGFVIAHKTQNYFVTDEPFVIMGSSNKSTGALGLTDFNHSIVKEYLIKHNLIEYFDKYSIPVFPKLVLSSFVWLELLKFKDNYELDDSYLHVEYRNIFISMMSSNPIFDKKENLGMAEDFKQYSIYDTDIKQLQDNFIGKEVYFPNFSNDESQLFQHIIIDPRLFGITDVYGAALLCRQFMDSKKTFLPITLSAERQMPNSVNGGNKSKSGLRTFVKKIVRKLIS